MKNLNKKKKTFTYLCKYVDKDNCFLQDNANCFIYICVSRQMCLCAKKLLIIESFPLHIMTHIRLFRGERNFSTFELYVSIII